MKQSRRLNDDGEAEEQNTTSRTTMDLTTDIDSQAPTSLRKHA